MSLFPASSIPAGATGFDIDNSLRFNDDDSAYLSFSPSTTTGTKKWVWSGWVKRGNINANKMLFAAHQDDNNFTHFHFNTSDQLWIYGKTSNGNKFNTTTVAKFRDCSAWYHVLLAVDTTQATEANRLQFYVNGVLQSTSIAVNTDLNRESWMNHSSATERLGAKYDGGSIGDEYDGNMAEVHFIDNQSFFSDTSGTASTTFNIDSFGETGDYGEWKAKKVSGLTYGTNGFYLDFKNSGLIGEDNKDTVDIFGDSSGIALYRFEDNVNDASGNYNGTAGSITYSTDGVYTKCGVLNGSSSYLDYSSTNIQNIFEGSSGAGSVSIWFKPTTVTSSTMNLFAISTGAFSYGHDYWLVHYNSSGIYQDWRSNESGDTYESSAQLTASISAGIWYNLVITYNAGSFNYYLDGSSIGSRSTSVRFSNLTECQSGRYSSDAAFANCSLDNIRFFNKALSSSEVAELSNTNLGLDEAGTNNWTPNNLASTDQMVDTPTNNFCTWNPNAYRKSVLSQGNLSADSATPGATYGGAATFLMESGKWYWEYTTTGGYLQSYSGIHSNEVYFKNTQNSANSWLVYSSNSNMKKFNSGTGTTISGSSVSSGDIIQIAFDADAGKIWFGKNNTWSDSGNPATGANANFTTITPNAGYIPHFGVETPANLTHTNFGQDSSFAGNKTAQGNQDGNDIGDFYYTPPTGFLSLCTKNLPDPTVIPSEHFNALTYTGTGTTNVISLDGMTAADMWWDKYTGGAGAHQIFDRVRGLDKVMFPNLTNGDQTISGTAYSSSGGNITYTGVHNGNNILNNLNLIFAWKAGGAAVTNNEGNLTTSVSANVDAGFSAFTYTGVIASGNTLGHGLDKAPEMILIKVRSTYGGWVVYHKGIASDAETDVISLEQTAPAYDSANIWNDTAPSNTVITLGNNGAVSTTQNYLGYAFHSVAGYSKVGKYQAAGPTATDPEDNFIWLGFRPAFIMIKISSTYSGNWVMLNSKRLGYNPDNNSVSANLAGGENTADYVDFYSNGFKVRTDDNNINKAGQNYIFIAFAEVPFKFSNAR